MVYLNLFAGPATNDIAVEQRVELAQMREKYSH